MPKKTILKSSFDDCISGNTQHPIFMALEVAKVIRDYMDTMEIKPRFYSRYTFNFHVYNRNLTERELKLEIFKIHMGYGTPDLSYDVDTREFGGIIRESLLQSMLNNHTNGCYTPELDDIVNYLTVNNINAILPQTVDFTKWREWRSSSTLLREYLNTKGVNVIN